MADGSTKKIEDVKVGDEVKATDPETGATESKPVTTLWLNHDTDLTDVTVKVKSAEPTQSSASSSSSPASAAAKSDDSGKAAKAAEAGALLVAAATISVATTTVLHTTQHHPLWNRTANTWVNAADLELGDEFKTDEGATAEVVSVTNFTGAQDMRDLTVADVHTYYVSVAGATILVHNNDTDPCRSVADARSRLPERTNTDTATTGTFMAPGHEPFSIRSGGQSDLTDRANNLLRQSGALPPIPARSRYPSSQHPETEMAAHMRDERIPVGDVVINNNYVCGAPGRGEPMGCVPSVEAILRPGQQMRVHHDGVGSPLTIHGKSTLPEDA
jgi:SCP1.201-like deaminase/Pretoxin HINT domain